MQNANILYIEDDPEQHFLVTDVLEDEGHTVQVAESAAAARAFIAPIVGGRAAYDVVLLDYNLGTETSDPALADIRTHWGVDFPVIGFSQRPMAQNGIEGLYADPTKDGLFDLPGIIESIPDAQ